MHSIKKYYGALYFAVFIILLWGTTETFACQCFNMGFLRTVFSNSPLTQCYLYKEGNIIYKIEIFDKYNFASSTETGCSLETDYHDIFFRYNMSYLAAHNLCTQQIIDTCNSLKIYFIQKDF